MPHSASSMLRTWRHRWAELGVAGAGLPVLHALPAPVPAPAFTCSPLLQEKFAKTYGSFKVMYTVGYSVSLCALILALALLLGFRWGHGHSAQRGQEMGAGGTVPGRALTRLCSQQAALHEELHPHEPLRLLHPEGRVCVGHRRSAQDSLQRQNRRLQRAHLAE